MTGIHDSGGDAPRAFAATATGPDAVLRHDGVPADSESRVRGPVQTTHGKGRC